MTRRTFIAALGLTLAATATVSILAKEADPESVEPPIASTPAAAPVAALSPSEIVAKAPDTDWREMAAADLLVMDLAADAKGKARRVVIQLVPAPFAQGWVGNMRKLVAARWWDDASVYRVQDNYVTQWGDATEKKPLPEGLATVPESDYVFPVDFAMLAVARAAVFAEPQLDVVSTRDTYAEQTGFSLGWPVVHGQKTPETPRDMRKIYTSKAQPTGWLPHCYGMVGVARDMSPNTGSGAELYTVIGHAPRHLDRNIALVGRVVSGIEHLSSLPRGTGALGFYETPQERTPITRVRLASELPEAERPRFAWLSTDSASFRAYADARTNRRDPFFIRPAGGADICNIPVPVKPMA